MPAPRGTAVKAVSAAALLLLFAGMTAVVWTNPAAPRYLAELDEAWRGLVLPASPSILRTSRALFTIGGGAWMVPLRIAVTAWLLMRRRYTDVVVWLLAWMVADALTTGLKYGVDRLRPDGVDTTSFPSGHAKTAAQVAVGLALLTSERWRSWAMVAAAAWAAAMAFSRTVLDQHWLSDVIAGALLGSGCALGADALVRWVASRRKVRRDSPREIRDG